MSLEIIVFFKTRPFEKYNLPSFENKVKTRWVVQAHLASCMDFMVGNCYEM